MVSETIQKVIPSKGTRLAWLLVLTAIGTWGWMYSFLGYAVVGQEVTFAEWAEFEKWLFIAYGASESADKYSHAAMNK
jgi:hypothetical protein